MFFVNPGVQQRSTVKSLPLVLSLAPYNPSSLHIQGSSYETNPNDALRLLSLKLICIMFDTLPNIKVNWMTSYHWSTMGWASSKNPQVLSNETSLDTPETTTDDPGTTSLVPWILAGSWLYDERSEPEVVDVSICEVFLSLDLRIFEAWETTNPKHIFIHYPKLWCFMVIYHGRIRKKSHQQQTIPSFWRGRLSIRKGAGSPLWFPP